MRRRCCCCGSVGGGTYVANSCVAVVGKVGRPSSIRTPTPGTGGAVAVVAAPGPNNADCARRMGRAVVDCNDCAGAGASMDRIDTGGCNAGVVGATNTCGMADAGIGGGTSAGGRDPISCWIMLFKKERKYSKRGAVVDSCSK